MQIKKYRAPTLAAAFQQAQQELGDDAVLLHQRSVPTGPNQSETEITVAVDGNSPAKTTPSVRPFFSAAAPTQPKERVEAKRPLPPADSDQRNFDSLRNEISYIRQLLQRHNILRSTLPEALQMWQTALLDAGLPVEIANEFLAGLDEVLTPSALQRSDMVATAVTQRMVAGLPKVLAPLEPGPAGRPLVFVLVGPTGVGKTTTLAKLATHYSLRRRTSMAFITADTFRIGAVGQLRTYSDLIQAPLEIAYTPDDLAQQIRNHADKAMIFVDTPGRSPADTEQLEVLRSFVQAIDDPHLQIAVAAGTQLDDARRIIQRFAVAPPRGIVLTKMDETSVYGAAYSLVAQSQLPLSYVTTGQRVPEDITSANNQALVERLIKSAQSAMRNGSSAPPADPADLLPRGAVTRSSFSFMP